MGPGPAIQFAAMIAATSSPSALPGEDQPLGARCVDGGINFAVYSSTATRIEVCLFAEVDGAPVATIVLPGRSGHVHHGFVAGLHPGQLYGLRAHGAFAPEAGLLHDPNRLLVDPYARAIAWPTRASAPTLGTVAMLLPHDNAATTPKGVVIGEDEFDWGEDRPPRRAWSETLIYELHVKGMTQLHPGVPPALRGSYAGLATPPVIEHLRSLGVTAVELLPVHEIHDEPHLQQHGRVNYWGYSTLGFFAPSARYAHDRRPGAAVNEFKAMVRALHAAGIEVLLDVVYNHTCEGGPHGPTLSLRGLDNRSYYLLDPDDPGRSIDYTGCGNTLNTRHPQALQLVLDSLRYWVSEMHVDGFRFDLAPALSRRGPEFDRASAFLSAIHQDPVLGRVKLIAEAWDVGPGGYQVGGFPPPWREWNDKYRDGVRRFWRGDDGLLGDLAFRLTGSADLYQRPGRGPQASINYVTCHDGFSLRDLVSYARKHNLANGEDGRDGRDDELACNWGAEGPSEDREIAAIRARMIRNYAATLAVSLGVPMLCAGDELGRTQGGNNNAYCQDNEVSWIDWAGADAETLAFFRHALRLRQAAVLRRTSFFTGAGPAGSRLRDVAWLHPSGGELGPQDWASGQALGMLLGGDAIGEADAKGVALHGDSFLVLINGSPRALRFALPAVASAWARLIDTRVAETLAVPLPPGQTHYEMAPRSLVVLWITSVA